MNNKENQNQSTSDPVLSPFSANYPSVEDNEDNDEINVSSEESVSPYSRYFQMVAVAVLICGAIAGLIIGGAYPVVTVASDEIGDFATQNSSTFNWPLACYVWAGTIVSGAAWFAVSCHFLHQEEIIERLDRLIKK